MPTSYVTKLAKKHRMSVSAAEAKWEKAQKLAADQGQSDNYAYITSIFKNMMNEQHEPSFSSLFEDALQMISDHPQPSSISESQHQITESKKGKGLKKAAHAVYHRDYVKTKNKPYRKYDKKKREHAEAAGVNEGAWDYAKSVGGTLKDVGQYAGRSLRNIHATGKRDSMNAEFDRALQEWVQIFKEYREWIKTLPRKEQAKFAIKRQQPQMESTEVSSNETELAEGILDRFGGTFQRISQAGKHSPNEIMTTEQKGKSYQGQLQEKLVKIVNLMKKYGDNAQDGLEFAKRRINPAYYPHLQQGLQRAQAVPMATDSQQSSEQARQHPTGFAHEQRGNLARRKMRYA